MRTPPSYHHPRAGDTVEGGPGAAHDPVRTGWGSEGTSFAGVADSERVKALVVSPIDVNCPFGFGPSK